MLTREELIKMAAAHLAAGVDPTLVLAMVLGKVEGAERVSMTAAIDGLVLAEHWEDYETESRRHAARLNREIP